MPRSAPKLSAQAKLESHLPALGCVRDLLRAGANRTAIARLRMVLSAAAGARFAPRISAVLKQARSGHAEEGAQALQRMIATELRAIVRRARRA